MNLGCDTFRGHAAVLALLALFLASGALAQSWTQLSPISSLPAPRADATAVYNAAVNRMVLFGGASTYCGSPGANFNDTWLLSPEDGSGTPAWINTIPDGAIGSPPVRRGQTAVYDAVHDRMTIYGGDAENCSSDKLGDVWVLINAVGARGKPKWEKLPQSAARPQPRSDHAAIYDPVNNIMVIAGGTGTYGPLNDVWTLTNANGLGGLPTWTQLNPTGGPPPSNAMRATTYDPLSNRMTVFGGWVCCLGPISNEVWVLTGANGLTGDPQWVQLAPVGTGPSPRIGSTAAYDPLANRMIIFGGDTETGLSGQVNEVWVLNNSNGSGGTPQWDLIGFTGAQPAPRGGPGDTQNTIVYNPAANQVTIFGGDTPSGFVNDTWALIVPR